MKLKLFYKFALIITLVFAGLFVILSFCSRTFAVNSYLKDQQTHYKSVARAFSQFPDIRTVKSLQDYDAHRAESLRLLASSLDASLMVARPDNMIVFDSNAFHLGKNLRKEENRVTEKVQEIQYGLKTSFDLKPVYYDVDRLPSFISKLEDVSLAVNIPIYNDEQFVGQAVLEQRIRGLDEYAGLWRLPFATVLAGGWLLSLLSLNLLMKRWVVGPIGQLVDLSKRISKQDFSQRVEFSAGDEMEQLGKSFNTMIYNLEKKTQEVEKQTEGLIHLSSELEASNQELNRKQKLIDFDLRLAHNIQQELLPQVYPKIKGLRISSANFQVGEIGGDCFDFYKLSETKLGAFIGDVSGKGISAALVMAMATILFSQLKDQDASPSNILSKVNDIMHRHFGNQHSIYLTCFFLLIDMETMVMRYSCAGHNPPYLLHSADGSVEPLESEGFGLGMFASVAYEEKEIDLKKGDKLILYTDGVIDSRSESGEMFGSERLIQRVRNCMNKNGYRVTNYLLEELEEFARRGARTDDLTIMVIEVEDEKPPRA